MKLAASLVMAHDAVIDPAVSVVLCTNCCDQYFHMALASIESQTFADFEVVIVANGISDDDFDALSARACDPRVRVFRTLMKGVTFSRNLALHHCRAPLVAVMDADDIAYPERLAEQVRFFQEHPEISVCGSSYDVIDENGQPVASRRLPIEDKAIRQALSWGNPLCHPAVMFRRDAVLAVGGYSGNSAEDYELWIRLYEEKDFRFANLSQPLIGYRVPVVSLARRSRRAYIHVAGAQYRAFLLFKKPKWLVGCLISAAKAWFRATRP